MILQTRSENMWRKTETRKMTEVNHFVYEADLENRGIRITKYTGNADCVQIPAEIDGAPGRRFFDAVVRPGAIRQRNGSERDILFAALIHDGFLLSN